MRARVAPAAAAALALVPVVAATPAQAAPDLSWSCGEIGIHYTFDNDQTGGWWVVETSMNCTPAKWPKRYNNEIAPRPWKGKYLLFEHTGYVNQPYNRTTIIDATPAAANASVCVRAESLLYFPDNKSEAASKNKNSCFKTAAP